MIVIVLFFFIVTGVFAIIPVKLTEKRITIIKFEYFYPFFGMVTWYILMLFSIGNAISISNFIIESFWTTIASIAVPLIRFPLSFLNNKIIYKYSIILGVIPILTALLLRLFMPSLPE